MEAHVFVTFDRLIDHSSERTNEQTKATWKKTCATHTQSPIQKRREEAKKKFPHPFDLKLSFWIF